MTFTAPISSIRTQRLKKSPVLSITPEFHQIKIIVRHLTKEPKSLAAQELRELGLALSKTTQKAFTVALDAWVERAS